MGRRISSAAYCILGSFAFFRMSVLLAFKWHLYWLDSKRTGISNIYLQCSIIYNVGNKALGDEIRNLFPLHVREFIMQDPKIANPPTLILPLRKLVRELQSKEKSIQENSHSRFTQFLSSMNCGHSLWKDLSRRLRQVLSWLENTQVSYSSSGDWNGFRWLGRDISKVGSRGNMPLTFASGIDDYPRALVSRIFIKGYQVDWEF